MGEASPLCDIDADVVGQHFCGEADPEPSWADRPTPIPNITPITDTISLTTPITTQDILHRHNRCKHTAPGPDGLRHSDWKQLDPQGVLLQKVFRLCQLAGRTPSSWKSSRSILLHKGGDPLEPSSWRPIALGNTVAKLYAGVIADRLSHWSESHNILTPSQKGFRPFDGVLEHNFVIQSAVAEARRHHTDTHIAFIDIKNAFGSVSHTLLWDTLRRLGVPTDTITIITDIYTDSTTHFTTLRGVSAPLLQRRGVRQGCPLSGILFALAMEPLLRSLTEARVQHLAYADDVALICRGEQQLSSSLALVSEVCAWAGLQISAHKCATLSPGTPLSAPARISGVPLPSVTAESQYKYLGRPTGRSYRPETASDVLSDAQSSSIRLLSSPLAPWQKLDALRTFIFPCLTHSLRLGLITKSALQRFQREIVWRVKGILNLPSRASLSYLFSSTSSGGIGLTNVSQEADVLFVSSTLRLLHSPDPAVASLARDELEYVVRRRLGSAPTTQHLVDYLNGVQMRQGGDITSRTSRTRVAFQTVSKRTAVRWGIGADNIPALFLDGKEVPVRRASTTIREALRAHHLAELVARPQQGKVMACVAPQPVSSHYTYNGSFTRFSEWRFVHRARLGLVPLNAYKRGRSTNDTRCRRCGYVCETLPHVLCHCLPHSAAMQNRHNAILARLVRALPAEDRTSDRTRVNRRVLGLASALRPDLTVTRGNRVVIVDVVVPFENGPQALQAAAEEKVRKYTGLVNQLRAQGKQVELLPFVVGSLGTWFRDNERALAALRVGPRYRRLMRRLIVSETLRWSRDMYIEHVTGSRQYHSAPPRADSYLAPVGGQLAPLQHNTPPTHV